MVEYAGRAAMNLLRRGLRIRIARCKSLWTGAWFVSLAGLFLMRHQIGYLWFIWTSDGLRSVGMLFPAASLWLCLRAWRGHGWSASGSWWGLLILAVAVTAASLTDYTQVGMPPAPGWPMVQVVPVGVLLWAYVSGAVILFGGASAWRKAMFPIALLLFVNPVPHFVAILVDTPLQYVAARTARSFAAWLSIPLGGSELTLMFSSGFGMFLAPSCNGLRGAVAMGCLALILGYVYGLSTGLHALYVGGAIVLAYCLNLLRLMALVLFYGVARAAPLLARHAVAADYLIGGALFSLGALFLFGGPVKRRLLE